MNHRFHFSPARSLSHPLRRWIVASCIVCVQACAHSGPPPASRMPTQSARIAQRCPLLPENREATGDHFDRVFVEAANVLTSEPSDALAAKLSNQPVDVLRLGGVVISHGEKASIPYERCLDVGCAAREQWTVTITPELPKRAVDGARFEVVYSPQQSTHATRTEHLELRDQLPIVLDVANEQGAASSRLVLTPYLVGSEQELRALFECKEQRRESEKP